jgi:protein-tyrosine phosphatase
MIDIHNHLLPGFDDGSRDMPESLAMCRVAVQDGIRAIVATPHSGEDPGPDTRERVLAAVANVNRRIADKGMPLEVLPGMEVPVSPEIPELLADGRLLTLNRGRYLLVEFHPTQAPAGFENLVKRLRNTGHGVILGHVEKNLAIQNNPDYIFRVLREFTDQELLIQISADSLTGVAGAAALNTATLLLRNGLAHMIASDAHAPFLRGPRLSEAIIVATSLVGPNARRMVWDIPYAVVYGSALPVLWEARTTRRWWHSFRRVVRRVAGPRDRER